MPHPLRLGVSSCLLGDKVRYDGGHRLDRYITDILALHVEFVPVCPEVECGLPVPREAMRLEGDPEQPRLMTIGSRVDLTERMTAWVQGRLEQLEKEELCGFVFKARSPSSGLFRVKVYHTGSAPRAGSGLFAGAFARRFPNLPVEEEGRLHDQQLRENFLERIFAFRRWKDYLDSGSGLGGLVSFHARHKLQLLAHSPQHYREMGKLVAQGKEMASQELLSRYEALFMQGLSRHATLRKHTNVLQHVAGYFKKSLSPEEKEELHETIAGCHDGTVPLLVPLTLLRHYVRLSGNEYLVQQTYLDPDPRELLLRNHS